MNESDWWINGLTGDDANSGTSSAAPLRSHAELERRWGCDPVLEPPYEPGFFGRRLTVHFASSLPTTDPVNFVTRWAQDVTVHYVGEGQTTIATGTITAVVVKDTSPGANVPYEITDATKPAGFWAANLGRRVRITSGPRENAMFRVALETAPGTFRASEPAIPNQMLPGPSYQFQAVGVVPVVPQVGDTYALEWPFEITWGRFAVKSAGASDFTQFFASDFVVGNLAVNVRDEAFFPFLGSANVFFRAYACQFISVYSHVQSDSFAARTYFTSCGFGAELGRVYQDGLVLAVGGPMVILEACFVLGQFDPGRILGYGAPVICCFDTMVQGGQIQGDDIRIQSAAVFDSWATQFTPLGDGVRVAGVEFQGGFGAGKQAARISLGSWNKNDPNVRLWGSGNAGVGLRSGTGSRFLYRTTVPTITGAAGEAALADATTGRAWDEAGGAYLAPVPLTWANVAAVGSLHNVQQDAHILAVVAGE